MHDRIEDIRNRLESIGEELTDVSMELLREAVDEGSGKRPPADKPLGQARRAVEKAVRHLDGIDAEAADEVEQFD